MDAIERGRQARRLLADEVLLEAFEEAREDTIEGWENAELLEHRESYHGQMRGLTAIREVLERYAAEVEHFEATNPPVNEETTG